MQITQVECFVTVAEALSYRRAAEALHYSPSHVSQQVRRLEVELRIDLFERSTHHVTLTSAGESLRAAACELLEAHRRMVETASRLAPTRPCLRVLYSSGSAQYGVGSAHAFSSAHPEVNIELELSTNATIAQEILAGSAHVGFVLAARDFGSGIRCRRLGDFAQSHLLVPSNHPLAKKDNVTVHDLQGQRLLLPAHDVDPSHAQNVLDFLAERRITTDYRTIRFQSEEEAIHLVAAGFGLIIVGGSMVERQQSAADVRFRKFHGEVSRMSYLAIHRSGTRSKVAKQLIDTAVALAESRPQ